MVAQRHPPIVFDEDEELGYGEPMPIRLPADWELTDERFLEIGALNPEQILERTADGRLHLMTWPDGLSQRTTSKLHTFVGVWDLQVGGDVRGEAGGYFLPDESALAPDVSWVSPDQITARGGWDGQFRLAPRFVIEVLSPSQQLSDQQRKMRQWVDNGVRLGWLVDPYERRVWIYRADGSVEELEQPAELSGEDVCAGLTIDMAQVWPSD